MIKIRKLPPPQILVDNEKEWTEAFVKAAVQHRLNGTKIPELVKFRYRHPDIKSAILREAHKKCAYCESFVRDTHPGETDHIFPSSRDATKAFEWNNLVLVCHECNHRKSDHPQADEPIVDPVADEPSQHLIFFGPIIFPQLGDEKGRLTEMVVGLNRADAIERRQEKLMEISYMVDAWAKATPGTVTKAMYEGRLKKLAQPDNEYSYMLKCFVVQYCKLKLK